MRIRVNWQGGPTTYTVVDHRGQTLAQRATISSAQEYCNQVRPKQQRREKRDKK